MNTMRIRNASPRAISLNVEEIATSSTCVPALHVQIRNAQRVRLNELAPRLHLVAHQLGEDVVGLVGLANLYLQERADVRVERRFPELVGIHLAQALVALHRDALAAGGEDGSQQIARAEDRRLG